MTRCLRVGHVALVALVALVVLVAPGAQAATKVVEPRGATVTVRLNPKGVPIPFTIKVSGFLPEAEIFVEQCDGTSPENQKWSPTVDCDYGTQAAPLRADANGDATFPGSDPNFGFKPLRGESPEHLFNCLAVGDPDPHDGLSSSTRCQVRIATNYTQVTSDQLFITMRFEAKAAAKGQSSAVVIAFAGNCARGRRCGDRGRPQEATPISDVVPFACSALRRRRCGSASEAANRERLPRAFSPLCGASLDGG